jgi:hypothetical protein
MADFNINSPESWGLVLQEAARRGPKESAEAQRAYQASLATRKVNEGASASSSTSESTSRTSTTGPYSESELKADADRQIAASQAFTRELQAAITSVGNTGNTTAAATAAAGNSQSAATLAAGETAAAKADASVAARDLMRAATGDPNGTVVKLVARREDAMNAAWKLKEQIDAAEQTDWMADPLGALVNLIRVPQLKKAYNAVATTVNTASREIDTLQTQTNAQQAIDNGVTATKVRAEAAAQAEAQRQAALARASELQQQTRIQQVQLAQMAMQQAGVPLEARTRIFALLKESETTVIGERQGESLTRQEREQLPALILVNTKRLAVGQPEYTLSDFNKLDPKQRDLLVRNGQAEGMASSPGEFIRVLSANGGLNTLDKAAPQLAQFLRDRQSSAYTAKATEYLRNPLNGGQKFATLPLDEQTEKILDKAMEFELAEVRGEDRNFSKIDKSSPFYFRKVAAATNPDLQNNWVSKFIADEIAKNPNKLADNVEIPDQRLLDELTGRVVAIQASSVMSPRVKADSINATVRGFADFFRKGQTAQWEKSGAMQLGYPKPTEYVMRHNDHTAATGRGLQVWSEGELLHSVIARIRKINQTVDIFGTGLGATAANPYLPQPKE